MCPTGATKEVERRVDTYVCTYACRFIELSINEKHSLDEGVTVEAPLCVFLITIDQNLDMIAFRIC